MAEPFIDLTEEALSFDQAMQAHVAQAMQRPPEVVEVIAATLQDHAISPSTILPEAAPDNNELNTLTEEDWMSVANSAEPYVALWSHANRERIQRRWDSLPRAEWESDDVKAYEDLLLRAMPVTHGATLEGLNLAVVKAGKFLSNRALIDEGAVDMTRRGHTYIEDREMGLDGKVFLDFGRPHSARMGNRQPEILVVFEPDIMQQEGSFITERDVLDDEINHGSVRPAEHMREVLTPEDFYKVGASVIKMRASRRGDHYTVDEYARGEDSNFNQVDMPYHSAFEVKAPEASLDRVRHLVFRDQATCDAFVAEHGDAFRTMVVPDIEQALLRGEDIMGTRAIVEARLAEIESADYQRRREQLARVPADEQTMQYMLLPEGTTKTLDPATSGQEILESVEDAMKGVRQINQGRDALDTLGHEESYVPVTSVRIGRVVSGGGVSIIDGIEDHSL